MDYRNYDGIIYLRADKGDEILSSILDVCKKENVRSAFFSGIGGCSSAEIQTFIPEKGTFETERIEGMLELVSLTGNVISSEEDYSLHAHGIFSYKSGKSHKVTGGHIKAITVLYTGEIEIRPVSGGCIGMKINEETGTAMWNF